MTETLHQLVDRLAEEAKADLAAMARQARASINRGHGQYLRRMRERLASK